MLSTLLLITFYFAAHAIYDIEALLRAAHAALLHYA